MFQLLFALIIIVINTSFDNEKEYNANNEAFNMRDGHYTVNESEQVWTV